MGGWQLARSLSPTTGTAYPRSFLIIAVGVTIALLHFGREIFIPLALAFVLSFLLTPLVSWFQKLHIGPVHIGRAPAVLVAMALCLAMTVFLGWKVAAQLVEITTHLPEYRTNIEQKIEALRSHHSAPILQATNTVQQLNQQLTGPSGQPAGKTNGRSRATPPIPVQVTRPPASIFQE